MDTVKGYEITKSILFDNGRGIVLGNNPEAPAPYVTWQFTEVEGHRDYYWGHYSYDGDVVVFDFIHRVNAYQRQFGVSIVEVMPADALQARYCYYSTQRPVGPGTFPKTADNTPQLILNYDERKLVQQDDVEIHAWGEMVYAKPLTQAEMSDYELKAAADNPDLWAAQKEEAPKSKHEPTGKNHPKRSGPRDR